ncbi:MAG: gamma-glutamyltransferase family protein [Nodosilinea sp.]
MLCNLNNYPYPSRRRVILGHRGAVATSQHLATLAGMEMFWAGGNAVDAAIATAIALTVVEPTSNGIGSDAFALVWDGQLHGLNGSGRSSANLSMQDYADRAEVPTLGWLSVTVPGAVSAWFQLWQRWGKLPFEQLFAPAIRYAETGFPVSPVTALAWQQQEKVFLPLQDPEFQAFKQTFFAADRAPRTGETWGSLAFAHTLREIARTGGESFYRGKLATAIANFSAATGGPFTQSDFAQHQSDWVDPISTTYKNLRLWEIPPNGQGIAALMALNILAGLPIEASIRDSAASFHPQIEAMKLAFADVYGHVGDPAAMQVRVDQLLDPQYARERQALIGDRALPLAKTGLPRGGTVYLCTADADLMVSFIQSNYEGFGSGILVPDTGISLHCRAAGFSLEPGHANHIAPNKRPFHTIIPGFLTEANQPLGPFGVMGAPMQPQGHLQMVVNLANYGMNPQAALDAPRWRFLQGRQILVEAGVGAGVVNGLRDRGHDLQVAPETQFGKGQMILRHQGALVAASDPRSDGLALAY